MKRVMRIRKARWKFVKLVVALSSHRRLSRIKRNMRGSLCPFRVAVLRNSAMKNAIDNFLASNGIEEYASVRCASFTVASCCDGFFSSERSRIDRGWNRFFGLLLDFVRGIFTTHEMRPSVSVRISAIIFVSLNINECNTMAVEFVNMLFLSRFFYV